MVVGFYKLHTMLATRERRRHRRAMSSLTPRLCRPCRCAPGRHERRGLRVGIDASDYAAGSRLCSQKPPPGRAAATGGVSSEIARIK